MEYPPKNQTCCFTGHRSIPKTNKSIICDKIYQTIQALAQNGITAFVSGGAVGFDTLAALAVLKLRKVNPKIQLIVVIPCRNQSAKWSAADKKTYDEILINANEVICLNDTYITGCMHQRNRFLVKLSSVCVTYYTGKRGGTAYTVTAANQSGLQVINLADPYNPDTLQNTCF